VVGGCYIESTEIYNSGFFCPISDLASCDQLLSFALLDTV